MTKPILSLLSLCCRNSSEASDTPVQVVLLIELILQLKQVHLWHYPDWQLIPLVNLMKIEQQAN